MNEVVAIVEGATEQTFIRDQLAAHLASYGTLIRAVLPGRQRRHGGIRRWEGARQDIVRILREGRYCTTMFDYYAMPPDWPGRQIANTLPIEQRARHVENEMLAEITAIMGDRFNPQQFLPYIQLHEFEALTFADTHALASVISPLGRHTVENLVAVFEEIVQRAGSPEAINDNYETCPSRRISAIEPAYRKRVHGPIVTSRIGLAVLRQRCQHFASWIDGLEAIT